MVVDDTDGRIVGWQKRAYREKAAKKLEKAAPRRPPDARPLFPPKARQKQAGFVLEQNQSREC